MSDAARSALAQVYAIGAFGPSPPRLVLAERRLAGAYTIMGDGNDTEFRGAVQRGFGVAPPTTPGRAATGARATLLWQSPTQWLVVPLTAIDASALAAVHADIDRADGALVDVSHGRTAIRIAGAPAATVLAKGTGVDLHPRAFPVGSCAQTVLGRISAAIHKCDEMPVFDVFVARSFAASFWHWLTEASLEFGYRADPPIAG